LTFTPNDKSEVSATRDGQYILYQSQGKIWRVNANGSDARQLTNGALDVHPAASADGQWVIYASFLGWSPAIGGRPSLWKVPLQGGEPVQLSKEPLSYPSVSPDGKWIACSYYPAGEPRFSKRQTAVLSSEGGPVHVLSDLSDTDGELSWAADGEGMNFGRTLGGVTNIWCQTRKGASRVQLTNFSNDRIFTFRSSSDGKWLAMVRGRQVSNVVLIQDF
jgi:Tol biopolymer transport system component